MDGDSEIIVDEQGRLLRRVQRVKQPLDNNIQGATPVENSELENIQRASQLTSSASSDSQNKRKKTLHEEAEILRALQAETEALEKENARRECPVPKPKGVLGRFLGFSVEGSKDNVTSS